MTEFYECNILQITIMSFNNYFLYLKVKIHVPKGILQHQQKINKIKELHDMALKNRLHIKLCQSMCHDEAWTTL